MSSASDTSALPAAVPDDEQLARPAAAPTACVTLTGAGICPAPTIVSFDALGNLICSVGAAGSPDDHTRFLGFQDPGRAVVRVALTYLSTQADSLDDLHFSAAAPPTATPAATATATATVTPTATRSAPSAAALFLFPAAAAPGGQPAGAPAAAKVIPYLLTVDALDAGYGLKDAGGTIGSLAAPGACAFSFFGIRPVCSA